jgi:hypothetical protein
MGVIQFPQDPATPTPTPHTPKGAEPVYPYAPHEYKHLHIVGHLYDNGQYLPVKVFVAPEMIRVEQGSYWRREAERRGVRKGIIWGMLSALAVVFVLLLTVFNYQ